MVTNSCGREGGFFLAFQVAFSSKALLYLFGILIPSRNSAKPGGILQQHKFSPQRLLWNYSIPSSSSACSFFFGYPSPPGTTTTLSLLYLLLFFAGDLTEKFGEKNSPLPNVCCCCCYFSSSLSGFVCCCLCCCRISSGFVDGSCSVLCFWCCSPLPPLHGFLKPKIWIWNLGTLSEFLMMA